MQAVAKRIKGIRNALEIESPALFAVEIRPPAEAETLAKVQKQILGDIATFVSCRIKQLGQESSPGSMSGTDKGTTMIDKE
jgi:hypothetical protein